MCQIGSKTEIELFAISVFVCLFMYASLTWHLVPAFRKTTMRNLNCWFLYVLFFHWICLFCDLHMILFSNYKPQVSYRISFSFCLSRIIWTWSICASKKKYSRVHVCLFVCCCCFYKRDLYLFRIICREQPLIIWFMTWLIT